MKKIKFIAITAVFTLTTLVLHSCLDENEPEYPWLAFSTIRTIEGVDNGYYFNLDDASTLYPGDTTAVRNYQVIDGQRAFVYYKVLDEVQAGYDRTIKVGQIANILTKEIIDLTEENAEEIGDDKINVTRFWMAQGYLNLEFQYLGTHSSDKKHFLNLVRNTTIQENDTEEYINLEFRHNAEGDAPDRIGEGYVSFKLDQIQDELESAAGLRVRVNSIYDGEKFIVIKRKDSASETQTVSANVSAKMLKDAY